MTKRALSLLLTLVMVLSLCVPALAAEDFEAEAPAEVVEEAPEAPEAPVAPEAEEPADEPVVDEPAAEEPVEAVADEPEMASILPEDTEDLPYLVALGVVSKLNHWELEKTLDIAKTYKAKVDANEMYVMTSYIKVDQEESPAKEFLDAYETAQKCLDGINGVVVDIDVTDASVTEAIANLEKYFSKDDSVNGQGLLTDKVDDGNTGTDVTGSTGTYSDLMTAANLYAGLKAGASYTAVSAGGIMSDTAADQIQYKYGGRTYPITLSTANVGDNTKFTESDWTMSYSKAYLTALEKAQTEIKAFGKLDSPKYKDFAAVRETVLAAAKLEKEAALPEAGDAAALKAAVDAYDKVKDSYLASTAYAAQDANLGDRVADARLMLNTTLGLNGLNTYVRFNDVKQAIKDINDGLTLKANTFKFEKYKAVSTKEIDVTVTIAEFPNRTTDNDGTDYGYAMKIGNYYLTTDGKAVTTFDPATCIFDIDSSASSSSPEWANSTNYPNRLEATIPFKAFKVTGTGAVIESTNVDATNAEFSNKDTIQISFYRKSLTKDDPNDTYGAAIDTETLIFPKDAYFGPIIKKAWVGSYNTTPTGSDPAFAFDDLSDLNDSTGTNPGAATTSKAGSEIQVYIQMDAALTDYADGSTGPDPDDFLVGMINAANKRVVEKDTTAIGSAVTPATVNGLTNVYALADDGTTGADPYIVANDMKAALIELSHTDDTHKNDPAYDVVGVITRSSLAVEIDPLSKWGAVKEIKKALAAAKALVQSDYVLNVTAGETHVDGRPDIKTITDAFTTINNDVKAIETNITSTTVANTLRNRQEVMSVLYDIGRVYSYLGIKPVDNAALTALIEEVKLIKEDDYTYDSYGRMHDELEDAEEVNTDGGPYLQSEIDAAYKALKAAKDALVKEGAVDKTALTAAIASAKALVEADYTADSWAANKPLIDAAVTAAQAVVDNAQATQAQVNTALNTLTAAVGKLEKVKPEEPEGPKAPASGTGWNYYNNEWYFFKNGKLVSNYWVGKIDGASQWDSNWYYVGADGKMLTGMQYLDDLHGGYGWYFLQPTNTKQEIGKMLTGYQWVGGAYGECYFSTKSGSEGKCTWSELLGNWNGTTWVK